MYRPLFDITRSADSYKHAHWLLYPPGMQGMYSYFEARGFPEGWDDAVMFFGLQYYLKQYFVGQVVTLEGILKSHKRSIAHFGKDIYNINGWMHILEDHGGRLPLSIKAIPEGMIVPTSNLLLDIRETCPKCGWLPNWCETVLSHNWYPNVIGTHSRQRADDIRAALEISGTPELLPHKLHDFGFRGVTCPEQAAIGGLAHLTMFRGTDTTIACDLGMDFYSSEMPGDSIPAGEHSTVTAWGKEHEVDAIRHALTVFPDGFVAQPIDSYDLSHAVSQYINKDLKTLILSRNGTFVSRPDSGHPPAVDLAVIEAHGEAYGYEWNKKGYKVLPPQIRMIQGDKIDREMLREIMAELIANKWSIDNIAFGSGGGLLQRFDRDILQHAFKGAHVHGDGWERDICKTPKTMLSKSSKPGFLKLIHSNGGYLTVPEAHEGTNILQEVFRNGDLKIDHVFDDVRVRAAA